MKFAIFTACLLCGAAVMGRAYGTINDRFCPEKLEDALKPLANMVKRPCDLELEKYEKTKRTQGPDRDGLVEYYPVLSIILQFAPRGLPQKSLLEIVIVNLQNLYGIMAEASQATYKGHYEDWVDKVTSKICIACRHVRDLAMSGTTYVDKKTRQ